MNLSAGQQEMTSRKTGTAWEETRKTGTAWVVGREEWTRLHELETKKEKQSGWRGAEQRQEAGSRLDGGALGWR